MDRSASRVRAQLEGWRLLRGLHPAAIDLARTALIRQSAAADLLDPAYLEALLPRLGLNDEAEEEFPAELRGFCGQGLRVWQYPNQFAKYLACLAALGVTSYVELGIRHGGSFVVTVEVLERFRPLDFALGVDVIACPAMTAYGATNPRASFAWLNTQSPRFHELLHSLGAIDLVFIDSHHEEPQCRDEVARLQQHANMIALHDICNVGCPGVGRVWRELKGRGEYACFEFLDQYAGMGPYMGIGLAVRRERLAAATTGQRIDSA